MIRNLKVFSQNVWKNSLIVNILLETLTQFDIIFIQESPWSKIHKIPSPLNSEGEDLVGMAYHPNWLLFARNTDNRSDSPRVIAFINIRLSSLRFSLRSDIFNYRDILLISFFNNSVCHYISNIYSDLSHMALKYLKDIEVNIDNVLIMTRDFNIRDSLWDLSFPHHSSISDDLMIIADSFNLTLSTPTNSFPTRFSDTADEANSVIDLMFLQYGSSELNQHSICPDSRMSSDHAPLIINIPIIDKFINTSKLLIAPNSEQETAFVKDLITIFKNVEMSNITNKNNLEDIVNCIGTSINQAWTKNAKRSRISRHSKQWWTEEYSKSLNNYRTTRSCENWKKFKKIIKNTK